MIDVAADHIAKHLKPGLLHKVTGYYKYTYKYHG